MQDPTETVIELVQRHVRGENVEINETTSFESLDIDSLDMSILFIDLEDALAIDIGQSAQIDHLETVGDLIRLTAALQETKFARARALKEAPRIKRSWVSTTA